MRLPCHPIPAAAGVPLLAMLTGCVVAAAGAGVGGAIYISDRGAESIVRASGESALEAAERAFSDYEITRTEMRVEDGQERRQIKGRTKDDKVVTVTIEDQDDGFSKVKITASTSAVTWDKELARSLLERIIEYTG